MYLFRPFATVAQPPLGAMFHQLDHDGVDRSRADDPEALRLRAAPKWTKGHIIDPRP